MAVKKSKLHVYVLQWSEHGERYVLKHGAAYVQFYHALETKEGAKKDARYLMHNFYELFGQHSELRFRKRDGSFEKNAYTYPRSADPKRSKG